MNVVFKLIAAQYCISSRNQSFDLLCKSNEWFLYEMQHWAEITLTNPSVFDFFIAKSDEIYPKWGKCLLEILILIQHIFMSARSGTFPIRTYVLVAGRLSWVLVFWVKFLGEDKENRFNDVLDYLKTH